MPRRSSRRRDQARARSVAFLGLLLLPIGCPNQAAMAQSKEADSSTDAGVAIDAESPQRGDADADGQGDADRDSKIEPLPFVVVRAHDRKRFVLTPETDEGGFDEQDLVIARQAWAYRASEKTTDVHPRLLDIIYRAMRYFGKESVRLTSGYRPGSKSSMHYWGRAADFHLEGVSCRRLAKHLRKNGFVGVGFYPRTGGTHVDVRERSFFWVSWAPRGKRWRERGILHDLARQVDIDAREKGIDPPEPLPKQGIAARNRKLKRRRRARKRRGRVRRSKRAR